MNVLSSCTAVSWKCVTVNIAGASLWNSLAAAQRRWKLKIPCVSSTSHVSTNRRNIHHIQALSGVFVTYFLTGNVLCGYWRRGVVWCSVAGRLRVAV